MGKEPGGACSSATATTQRRSQRRPGAVGALARGIDQSQLAGAFHDIRDAFATPEDINDSPQTAPSKRLAVHYPPYDKVLHGSIAALDIGLPVIRDACPLFDGWLSTLEALGPSEA
ncbi:DUF4276 family protein [Lujinxingia sediminis]|uniref:DUF4276 family protein n=1 Tax=Lujinxingia sediminis TaxID=2480984 RepID=A0ABY0CUT0_9DELT|nr:DUF4276 family protein [Lujinxingia sediminis]